MSDVELAAVWRACADDDFGKLVKLLILTGCRRHEISALKWSEMSGNVLTIPAERSKNHKAHSLTLPPMVMQIVESIPREANYLFGTRGRGFKRWGFYLDKLRKRIPADMPPFVLHDLRRTFRTGLARIGVRPDVAERAVNHVQGGVLAIYDRHQYQGEIASALARWADHVAALIEGRDGSNVVPLQA